VSLRINTPWQGQSDQFERRAAVLAMRDAAALIVLQMDKSTGISKLKDARVRRNSAPTEIIPESANIQTTAAEDVPDESGN